MKNIFLATALLLSTCFVASGQIPILYYDCENNSSRSSYEVTPELVVNSASNITYTTSLGGCNTIGCPNAQGLAGAAATLHGGSIDGGNVSASAWQTTASDPTTAATSYYQFNLSTSGFTGISLTFDAKFGNGNAPSGIGVLISPSGAAGSWVFVGSSATPNSNTISVPSAIHSWVTCNMNLTAASSSAADNNGTLYVRVYGWGGSATGNGAYMALDNITVLANATVGSKVFTSLNENAYYTGYTSGLTGSVITRGNFTVTGTSTMTVNNTSGLKLASGKTLKVNSGSQVTFPASGVLSGTGGIFNIASGGTVATSNTGGLVSSITTTGSNVYTAGANYIFNAATTTPFPTGTLGNPSNVTINAGAGNVVALNINPTITGTLSFSSGKLSIGNHTIDLSGTVSGMSASNVITGGATSVMNIGGSGVLGTLYLDQTTPGTTNNFSSFTMNKASSGSATLGNAMKVGSGGLNLANGTLYDGGNIITVAGDITGTGAHSGSGKITMTSGGSTISGVSLGNLDLNNSGGFSLTGSPSIGGTLTLTSGKLTLGSQNLILGIASAVAGVPSSTRMVVANGTGQMRKLFAADGAFLFPIGDATNYTPVTIDMTASSYAGGAYAGANLQTVKHPSNANSTNYLNRYWQITTSGITAPSYTIAANYVAGDVVGSDASVSAGTYTGALPWIKDGAANAGTRTITTNTITNLTADVTGITTDGPAVTTPATQTRCGLGIVPIDATGTGDAALTYSWSPSTGLSATTGSSVSATPMSTTDYTVTVTDGNGFTATSVSHVNVIGTLPITGDNPVCYGANGHLSYPIAGGTWTSGNTAIMTIGSSSGDLTGVSVGTTYVTYTMSPGCFVQEMFTVNAAPPAIAGATGVCPGTSSTFMNGEPGGTWSSSTAAVGTINSSGSFNGISAGTSNISYTNSHGCVATTVATVYPVPNAPTGPSSVCVGQSITLSHDEPGGSWASANTARAIVNSAGYVTAVSAGNVTISYTTPNGCVTTKDIVVNPLPGFLLVPGPVCEGSTIPLSDADAGGAWAVFPSAIATVDAGTGVLTGVSGGLATVVYTLPTGCSTNGTATVNALPDVTAGATDVCVGSSITLSSMVSGGIWSSSGSTIASVSTGGVVSGVSNGVTNINYTAPNGCARSVSITVNPLPGVITGVPVVCEGMTTTLVPTESTGTWSTSTPLVGLIASSGIYTAISSGSGLCTWTLPTGCARTISTTVNPVPGSITSSLEVCAAGGTLAITVGGGVGIETWAIASPSIATIDGTTGAATGVAAGTTDVTYTSPLGCYSVAVLTVNPLPDPITGPAGICIGGNATYASNIGGMWSTGSSTLSIDVMTGEANTLAVGDAMITYTLPTGCKQTKVVTVNALPASITGPDVVCEHTSITLANVNAGTWSTASANVSVVASTGVVQGITNGTASITFTATTGCTTEKVITINAAPAVPAGSVPICEQANVTLTDADAGGTWSTTSANVTVNASTGDVHALFSGTATISYTIANGCSSTAVVTVNAVPSTISGTYALCAGDNTILGSVPVGGTWQSANTATATINASGLLAGVSGGTTVITYTEPVHSCKRTAIITVNVLPGAIAGVAAQCEGTDLFLTNSLAGGTWSVNNTALATIDATGRLHGESHGNPIISYRSGAGCLKTAIGTVNAVPAAIGGADRVCESGVASVTNADAGGTWSVASTTIASISPTGDITGLVAGATTVGYTFGTGCAAYKTFTVDPVPAAITGTLEVCKGAATPLANATPGGSWLTDGAHASISFTGTLTGSSAGNGYVSYTLATGCRAIAVYSVNATPAPINGSLNSCAGQSTVLSDADGGGVWISGNTAIATSATDGTVTGVMAGTVRITYQFPSGCSTSRIFTVNVSPLAFGGAGSVCHGMAANMTNTLTGGTWASSDNGIVTVGGLTGIISGISPGTASIVYTLPNGCSSSRVVTVNSMASNILGSDTVCMQTITPFSHDTPGGIWQSSNSSVATVGSATGIVYGFTAGTARISYTLPSGCRTIREVTVNALPALITGPLQTCEGSDITLSSATSGGAWSSVATTVVSVGTDGTVSGIAAGTAVVSYTLSSGCGRAKAVTVNAAPAIETMTGGGSYCEGGAGVHVGLLNSAIGANYRLYNGSTLIVSKPGTGSSIDFGSMVAAGTYTVAGVTGITNCAIGMSGTAAVSITPTVLATVAILANDTVCSGTEVHFGSSAAHSGSAPVYTWYVNNVATGSADTFVYTPANGDSIVLTMNSNELCAMPVEASSARRMLVLNNETPTIVVNQITANPICQFSTVDFDATTTWTGSTPAYAWKKNGVVVGSGATYSYVPANGDHISCVLTSSYACVTAAAVNSNTVDMVVDSIYIPTISLNALPGLTMTAGTVGTVTATVVNGGPMPTYTWQINGSTISGETNATLMRTFADGDVVTCNVKGSGACGLSAFNSVALQVTNGVGVNDVDDVTGIVLYPNPNRGAFVLEMNGELSGSSASIAIMDVTGRVVFADTWAGNDARKELNLGGKLSAGVYVIRVVNGAIEHTLRFTVTE